MSNIVHIDEKLFYLTRLEQTYYLTPEEEDHIEKFNKKDTCPKSCTSMQWLNHYFQMMVN